MEGKVGAGKGGSGRVVEGVRGMRRRFLWRRKKRCTCWSVCISYMRVPAIANSSRWRESSVPKSNADVSAGLCLRCEAAAEVAVAETARNLCSEAVQRIATGVEEEVTRGAGICPGLIRLLALLEHMGAPTRAWAAVGVMNAWPGAG